MFRIDTDNSIYVTRGDAVLFGVKAKKFGTDEPYTFMPGDLVRIKVYKKKKASEVVLEKDFPVTEVTQTVQIFLSSEETKIGDVISKPVVYWYEVELNPTSDPQTIIGYDEDGAKVFMLFPEGADKEVEEYEPGEEELLNRYLDDELDVTSKRPVENQAVARALLRIEGQVMTEIHGMHERTFKPKVIDNPWLPNRNKAVIEELIKAKTDMGIEGFVLCFHISEIDTAASTVKVDEYVDAVYEAFSAYADKGGYISAIKFHCTLEGLETDAEMQALYKEKVLEIAEKFSDLKISKCVVFNERANIFTEGNATYIKSVISDLKGCGYAVSVNANHCASLLANYRDFPEIVQEYDFVSVNMYPCCGNKGRATSAQDCVRAWERLLTLNDMLEELNKPFYLTETGIRPYYNYFVAPAAYDYDEEANYSIDVQVTYLKGLFESPINDIAQEVWLWFFPATYEEKLAKLIKSVTVGGD